MVLGKYQCVRKIKGGQYIHSVPSGLLAFGSLGLRVSLGLLGLRGIEFRVLGALWSWDLEFVGFGSRGLWVPRLLGLGVLGDSDLGEL